MVPSTALAQWRWTPETGRFINLKRMPKETPELQVEYARSLMLGGKHAEALKETAKFMDFYPDSEAAAANRFLRGQIKMGETDYLDAAKEFQQVVVNYPESDLYDAVIENQYGAGDALYELGRKQIGKAQKRKWYRLGIKWRPFNKRPMMHAIDVYSMVIENQPFTTEAAEAQFKLGLCHYTLKDYIDAAFEYRRVTEDYMGSAWQAEAGFGLAQCYTKGALDRAYDQSPSLFAIEAIDDFSTTYPADPRNSELAEVRAEMREKIAGQRLQTARFYERRRRFDSARLYYQVVLDQFGETEAAQAARKGLEAYPEN